MDQFYRRGSKPSSYCKDCAKAGQALWTEQNRERKADINRNWRSRHKDRRKVMMTATNRLWAAIRAGRIIRGETCQKCGSSTDIEAAHHDYDQPLSVSWLCAKCHRQWDADHPKSILVWRFLTRPRYEAVPPRGSRH